MSLLGLRTGRITGTAVDFTGPTCGTDLQTGRVWMEEKSKWVGSGTKRLSTAVGGRFLIRALNYNIFDK